ncbi:MAG: hypothetical protein HXS54_06720 [Theionarchaea archaeon]|nr:hypothetical protein [Theionarchaea archaeon]
MLSRKGLLLLLLYAKGKSDEINEALKGRLKLMKLAFPLEKEGDIGKYSKDSYHFEVLNCGPFSRELIQELNVLVKEDLIEKI